MDEVTQENLLSRYDFFKSAFKRVREKHPDWSIVDILRALGNEWGLSLHRVQELFERHRRYAETIGESWFNIRRQPFPALSNSHQRMKTPARAIFGTPSQKTSFAATHLDYRSTQREESQSVRVKQADLTQIRLPKKLEEAYEALLTQATLVDDLLIVIAPTGILTKRFGPSKGISLYQELRRRGVLKEVDSKFITKVGKETKYRVKAFRLLPKDKIVFVETPSTPAGLKHRPKPTRKEPLPPKQIREDLGTEELLLRLLHQIGKELQATSLPIPRQKEERIVGLLRLAQDAIALLAE